MSDRWGRLAPLLGVVFVVLILVGIIGSGESPEADSSSAKVVAYYREHSSKVKAFDIIFIFAFIALVAFVAVLRSYLRRTAAAEGAAALALAGAVLMAAGALVGIGVELGIAENISHLEPATAQALNLITDETFVPALGGAALLGISSGAAILRGANLPRWLGWVAIVIGILAVVPPTTFPALFALVLWSLIVSIVMFLRSGQRPAEAPAALGASGT